MLYYIYVFNTLSIKQSTNNHECASPCTKPLRYKKKKLLLGNGMCPLAPIVTLAEIISLITGQGNILRKTILGKVLMKNGK